MASTQTTPASLLTLPSELRNTIYFYLFACDSRDLRPVHSHSKPSRGRQHRLALLQSNRQLHNEANLLAYTHIPIHISGAYTYPELFCSHISPIRESKLRAIRHIRLKARTTELRALNETWNGLPFGHEHLRLETLTIIPTRADASNSPYLEVANLSQSHTLAYVLGECLKSLKHVKCLTVVNEGCFERGVWSLVYTTLVYRLWRWGGNCCGLRFVRGGGVEDGEGWFQVLAVDCGSDTGAQDGREAGEEVMALIGREGEVPELTAAV